MKLKTSTWIVIGAGAVAVISALAVILCLTVFPPASTYREARKLQKEHNYEEALEIFEDLGSYKDSEMRADNCRICLVEVKIDSRDFDGAMDILITMDESEMVDDLVMQCRFGKAEDLKLAGKFDEAIAAFQELGNYEGCADQIQDCYYGKADLLVAAKDYRGAYYAFKDLGAFKDAPTRVNQMRAKMVKKNTIACGGDCTLAIKNDGTVIATTIGLTAEEQKWMEYYPDDYQWYYGQNKVNSWNNMISLSAAKRHSVGLRADGTVVAVGDNSGGQCNVSGWTDIIAIATGSLHTVGLRADGTVVSTSVPNITPDMYYDVAWEYDNQQDQVSDWRDIIAIAASDMLTVGLKDDGTVVTTHKELQKQIDMNQLSGVVSVLAGNDFIICMKEDGTATAITTDWTFVSKISNWTTAVAASASHYHAVVLNADGTCEAAKASILSDPYFEHMYVGQGKVYDWTDIVDICTGYSHTVGLKSDGTLVSAGGYERGQRKLDEFTDIRLPGDG